MVQDSVDKLIPEQESVAARQTVVDATGAHIPAHIIHRAKKVLQRQSSNLLGRNRRRSLEILGPTIAPVEEERERFSSSNEERISASSSSAINDLPHEHALETRTTPKKAHVVLARSFARTFSMPTTFDEKEDQFAHFFSAESSPLSPLDEQEKGLARFFTTESLPSTALYTLDEHEEGEEEDFQYAYEISETTTMPGEEKETSRKDESPRSTLLQGDLASIPRKTLLQVDSTSTLATSHSKKSVATPDCMKIEETPELYELWESCAEWSAEQVKSMVFTTGMPWKRRLSLWPRLLGIDDEPIIFRDDVDQCIIDEIEKDVHRTIPELFSDLHRRSLRRILISYAATYRSVGYCQSMNLICGLLLIVGFDDETTLKMFTKLLDVYCPDYHSPHLSGVVRDSGVIEVLLAHWFPEIYEKMAYANIPVIWVVSEHLMTLCVREWRLDTVLWLWDIFMAFGPSAVLSTNLAIIDLYFPAEFSLNRRMTDESLDAILNGKTSKHPPKEPETLNSPLISLDPAQTTKPRPQENNPTLLNLSRRSIRSDRAKFKKSKSRVHLRDPAEILHCFRRNARNNLMTREGAHSLIRRIREFQSEITMETVNDLRSQL